MKKTYKAKIRLYLDQPLITNNLFEIDSKQAHYLSKVMRLKQGDKILVFNEDDGEYISDIVNAGSKNFQLLVKDKTQAPIKSKPLSLYFAPVKNAPLTNIIQKATELGVTKLQPVLTQRTIVKHVNLERLKSIAIESSEQCLRIDVPKIYEPISLYDLLNNWSEEQFLTMCDETGNGKNLQNYLQNYNNLVMSFLVGPEGGFGQNDFDLLDSKKFIKKVSMGSRILRADTAAIVALSAYQAIAGDFNAK